MYVITMKNGDVIGTTNIETMEYLTENNDYISVVYVEDLDRASDMVDYVEE